MTERELQDAIVELATLLGWLTYHMHDSRKAAWGTSSAGFPDLVMVGKHRLIFAELKTEKGKLSAEQVMWIAALDALDPGRAVETYVWRPSQWLSGEIERILR